MAQPDIDFCGVGLPDDLDSQLRSVCHDVVESMGRTNSSGFLAALLPRFLGSLVPCLIACFVARLFDCVIA